MINADLIFAEQTGFVIFLWMGVWGLMEHFLASVSTNTRILVYCSLVVVSCCLLYARGHTKKLASL
jgi:hypothetical protein